MQATGVYTTGATLISTDLAARCAAAAARGCQDEDTEVHALACTFLALLGCRAVPEVPSGSSADAGNASPAAASFASSGALCAFAVYAQHLVSCDGKPGERRSVAEVQRVLHSLAAAECDHMQVLAMDVPGIDIKHHAHAVGLGAGTG